MIALARDYGAHRDDMIGIGRVAHAKEKANSDEREEGNHADSFFWIGSEVVRLGAATRHAIRMPRYFSVGTLRRAVLGVNAEFAVRACWKGY